MLVFCYHHAHYVSGSREIMSTQNHVNFFAKFFSPAKVNPLKLWQNWIRENKFTGKLISQKLLFTKSDFLKVVYLKELCVVIVWLPESQFFQITPTKWNLSKSEVLCLAIWKNYVTKISVNCTCVFFRPEKYRPKIQKSGYFPLYDYIFLK